MTLQIRELTAAYGDIQVLWDLNLTASKGEVVALVGSNGAGKTTFLRAVSGLLNIRSGQILMNGQDLSAMPPARRVACGIAHVPEGRQLFYGLSVRENILTGAYLRKDRREIQKDLELMFDTFPEIAARRRQQAGTLSGGEQQMVAIARGLMSKPEILLIDELSLGLAPVIVERLFHLIKKIQQELGIGVILVEQDVEMACEMSDRGYVIELGRITREGCGTDLLDDDAIKKAYLGM